jgi:hypothetical protein
VLGLGHVEVPDVALGLACFRGSWSSGWGRRRSGRGVEFSDPGEHDGQQLVAGWQSQGQGAAVTDQSGWDAEEFVAEPGGVGSAVGVDPGERLEQGLEVPASSAAHIHTAFTAWCPDGMYRRAAPSLASRIRSTPRPVLRPSWPCRPRRGLNWPSCRDKWGVGGDWPSQGPRPGELHSESAHVRQTLGVGPVGLEPTTNGLKVRSSAN